MLPMLQAAEKYYYDHNCAIFFVFRYCYSKYLIIKLLGRILWISFAHFLRNLCSSRNNVQIKNVKSNNIKFNNVEIYNYM